MRAIGDTMRQIFDEAEASGTTPLGAAMDLAARRVAEAEAGGRVGSPAV